MLPTESQSDSSSMRDQASRANRWRPGWSSRPQPTRRRSRRLGATAIEYCVVVSMISVVVIAGTQQFGGATASLFKTAATELEKAAGSSSPNP